MCGKGALVSLKAMKKGGDEKVRDTFFMPCFPLCVPVIQAPIPARVEQAQKSAENFEFYTNLN